MRLSDVGLGEKARLFEIRKILFQRLDGWRLNEIIADKEVEWIAASPRGFRPSMLMQAKDVDINVPRY